MEDITQLIIYNSILHFAPVSETDFVTQFDSFKCWYIRVLNVGHGNVLETSDHLANNFRTVPNLHCQDT